MENIKVGYIPVGQVVRKKYLTIEANRFIKENKIGLIIGAISISLLSIYTVLIINFINLLKVLN